jgi:hypothetical protein
LRDVGALGGDGVHDEHLVGMEHIVVVRVADATDGFAGDGVEIELRLGGDFTADHHEVGLGVRLASHAAVFVLGQTRVKDGIRNRVADFVRMAFADGLRREDVVFAHSI